MPSVNTCSGECIAPRRRFADSHMRGGLALVLLAVAVAVGAGCNDNGGADREPGAAREEWMHEVVMFETEGSPPTRVEIWRTLDPAAKPQRSRRAITVDGRVTSDVASLLSEAADGTLQQEDATYNPEGVRDQAFQDVTESLSADGRELAIAPSRLPASAVDYGTWRSLGRSVRQGRHVSVYGGTAKVVAFEVADRRDFPKGWVVSTRPANAQVRYFTDAKSGDPVALVVPELRVTPANRSGTTLQRKTVWQFLISEVQRGDPAPVFDLRHVHPEAEVRAP